MKEKEKGNACPFLLLCYQGLPVTCHPRLLPNTFPQGRSHQQETSGTDPCRQKTCVPPNFFENQNEVFNFLHISKYSAKLFPFRPPVRFFFLKY